VSPSFFLWSCLRANKLTMPLQAVVLPAWVKWVVVVADAAYPSRANLQAIQARHWFFVLAFPRTWKVANGQHLRDLVTHLPVHSYCQVRVLLVVPSARRRVFWTVAKRAELRQVGDVTVVLSRRRRNDSPRHTKLLVTNLPQATDHLTVALDLRRWPVELCIKELKSVVGLGQSHVTKNAARVERSVAVALMAYLLVLRRRPNRFSQAAPGVPLLSSRGSRGTGAHVKCSGRHVKQRAGGVAYGLPRRRCNCGLPRESITHPVNFEYFHDLEGFTRNTSTREVNHAGINDSATCIHEYPPANRRWAKDNRERNTSRVIVRQRCPKVISPLANANCSDVDAIVGVRWRIDCARQLSRRWRLTASSLRT
jgi:hypothetical protein